MLVVATTWPCALVERTPLEMPENQVVPSVANVDDEFAKVWRPVHEFAFARLRLKVWVPEPLYAEPESPVPAERFARVPPRETPLMVEFWSWLLPMVEVATTWPAALTERSVFEREVRYVAPELVNCVVEALVNCVKAVWVEEALSM